MDQEKLKTSTKQRIFIGAIAVIMVLSIIASYAAIIMAGGSSTTTDSGLDPAVIEKYYKAYTSKTTELSELTKPEFDEFINFKSEIVAYNEATANETVLSTRDLKVGNGRVLGAEDYDYLAFYVGWCADETIFDSSFDNSTSPTTFSNVLSGSANMIEGWKQGIVGMQLGGIREITIPGELAYADAQEICGGYNKPLKFIIMALDNSGELGNLASELDLARTKYIYATSYGIDYDAMFVNSANNDGAGEE